MAALPTYGQHQPSTVGSRIEAVTCQQPVAAAKATRLAIAASCEAESHLGFPGWAQYVSVLFADLDAVRTRVDAEAQTPKPKRRLPP